jgi:hypothetical protein
MHSVDFREGNQSGKQKSPKSHKRAALFDGNSGRMWGDADFISVLD